MEPNIWFEAVSRIGFPAVVAVAMGFAIWKFGRSFHDTVVSPLVQAHINFLQEQTTTSKTVAGAIQKQTESIDAIKDSQVEMSQSVKMLAELGLRDERGRTR